MKSTPTLVHLLREVLTEMRLSVENAVEFKDGKFTVGKINYEYYYNKLNINGKEIDDIGFDQEGNTTPNLPVGNTEKSEIIKVYSTMYAIILDFLNTNKPELFSISALKQSDYHRRYLWLLKDNMPPGYFKVNSHLEISNEQGQTLDVILLKKFS